MVGAMVFLFILVSYTAGRVPAWEKPWTTMEKFMEGGKVLAAFGLLVVIATVMLAVGYALRGEEVVSDTPEGWRRWLKRNDNKSRK
ncbi:MAG: hypothetical protein A2571_03305 [Candidatus Vogelbacteria bacterium RIFOXYD1_FULL_44_32]|uniref:Uncharacterized protein n=1 Tax=Candidatus Vogelbacteria bacterium RIFOXYD1_FULL_44_32 TaxID=1802438 RepID=A0A1G2QCP7_9BACT|nr:MAG: hypothetical protein A2571_03305 [Candidatus Vogelbacteria bacterium RIFOXYD1_FULL_44_32]